MKAAKRRNSLPHWGDVIRSQVWFMTWSSCSSENVGEKQLKMLGCGGAFNLNLHISNGRRRNHHKLQQNAGMKMFLMRCSHPPLLQDKRTSRSCVCLCALALFTLFSSPPAALDASQCKILQLLCPSHPYQPPLPPPPISLSKNFHLNEDPASLFCCAETGLGGRGLDSSEPPSLRRTNASTPPASRLRPCAPLTLPA